MPTPKPPPPLPPLFSRKFHDGLSVFLLAASGKADGFLLLVSAGKQAEPERLNK